MKKMVYTSLSELPFFEPYRENNEEFFNELEIENTRRDDTNRNSLSILDSSKGNMQINRSEIIEKKKKCDC